MSISLSPFREKVFPVKPIHPSTSDTQGKCLAYHSPLLKVLIAAACTYDSTLESLVHSSLANMLPSSYCTPVLSLFCQMSGGNIFVPIIAHVVYDLLTFLEVHQRATAQLEISLNGDVQQKEQVLLY